MSMVENGITALRRTLGLSPSPEEDDVPLDVWDDGPVQFGRPPSPPKYLATKEQYSTLDASDWNDLIGAVQDLQRRKR